VEAVKKNRILAGLRLPRVRGERQRRPTGSCTRGERGMKKIVYFLGYVSRAFAASAQRAFPWRREGAKKHCRLRGLRHAKQNVIAAGRQLAGRRGPSPKFARVDVLGRGTIGPGRRCGRPSGATSGRSSGASRMSGPSARAKRVGMVPLATLWSPLFVSGPPKQAPHIPGGSRTRAGDRTRRASSGV
jgi:hypothetical protein